MPANKLSQKSFVNGQYDRTAQNQESVSQGGIVATGFSYGKNVLSSDRGELRKRLGTKHLAELPGATVLIPFRMPNEDDIILTVDANNIAGYKYISSGTLAQLYSVSPESSVSFPAGNTWSDGSSSDNYITNGDWTVSFSFRMGGSMVTLYPGRLLNDPTNGYGSYILNRNAPQYISFYNSNTDCCMRSVKIWFFTKSSTGYQYEYLTNPIIEYSDDGITWLGVQTDYTVGEYTPVSYTPPYNVSTPGGTIHVDAVYKSKCSITISQDNYGVNHRYWRIYFQTGKIAGGIFVDGASFVNASVQTLFQETSPYTEDQLKKIKYAQDKNKMFIACEDVIPYEFVNNTGQLTLTSFTPANTPQMWSNSGGYPTGVALFQNRLWFAGFENKPTTVLASKFDDYETFNASNPVQKDDYLNLTCNQLKCRIKNIVGGQKVLYCFSQDGISNVDGGSTGMLATNENIEFILKNRMPAGDATPAFKDDIMLYSSSDGTKLYGVDYDLITERFQVADLAKYAKDITKAKITEMHYVNNESKLVYGLTEDGKMFALLYEKGQYQGFFPLDFGDMVYDICPVKVGRNYKLLMVVLRDGNWYLEEKLDAGNYINTSSPRMTSEEQKWATYDNLENNIAMDCYQSYDEGFGAIVRTVGENKIISDTDLTNYVDKNVMFGNVGSQDWLICNIDSADSALYGWSGSVTCWTESATPVANDPVYDADGGAMNYKVTGYTADDGYGNETLSIISTIDIGGVYPGYTLQRESGNDEYVYNVTVDAQRGESTGFTMIYPEFTEFAPNLPQVANVGVVSEGRYFNATKPDENAKIYLPVPCHKVIYGVVYEALAIIKIQVPYESLKNVSQIDVSVIDTTHLEIGTAFDDMENIEKINDSSYYDLTQITMNDIYRQVVSDTPEPTKNIILYSNKGLPFTLTSMDVYINYSNLGGD